VIKVLLDQQFGYIGLSASQSSLNSISNAQDALRAVNISQSSYAKRQSTSLSKSDKTPISDAIRLQVISETIESLQTTIKSSNTAALSNVAAISAQMKNERTLLYLIEIADKSKGDAEMIELPTERDFDATVKSALILSAL